ncbi:hypothetical protein, partial [Oleiphilus sp. HI0123]
QIRSTDTNELIKQRRDTGGYHMPRAFSADGEKLLYVTHCRHGYLNPCVTVWDFVKGKAWNLMTKHHRGTYLGFPSYNDDFSVIALSDSDGEVSLVKPYENKTDWHRRLSDQKIDIQRLHLNEEKKAVWATLESGSIGLSQENGTVQSVYHNDSGDRH